MVNQTKKESGGSSSALTPLCKNKLHKLNTPQFIWNAEHSFGFADCVTSREQNKKNSSHPAPPHLSQQLTSTTAPGRGEKRLGQRSLKTTAAIMGLRPATYTHAPSPPPPGRSRLPQAGQKATRDPSNKTSTTPPHLQSRDQSNL